MDLLSGIKYIFQIPLEWFKRVDTRVFGDHPGPGIQFMDAMDGSRAVSVDFDVLGDRFMEKDPSLSPVDSATQKVISGVTWNGTQLVISSDTWTIRKGLVVGISSNNDEVIDTVTYTP